ncbi:MAG: hypothetical protein ABSC19_13455 [Syntrophorhabdales bacterium]|jgi:hypothetical protein
MEWKIADRRTRLNIISIIILLVGLLGAIVIYARAGNESGGVLGYENGDDSAYPIMPDDSKVYERNMELYGGKANVLADEFRRWVIGLFHGTSLALIVACVTILVSFGVFYAANYLPPPLRSDDRGPDNRNGPP